MNEGNLITIPRAATSIDSGAWWMRCPAHQGAWSSSLQVRWSEGRVQMHCFAGCSATGILCAAEAGRKASDDAL
jgi:hypothetical protein